MDNKFIFVFILIVNSVAISNSAEENNVFEYEIQAGSPPDDYSTYDVKGEIARETKGIRVSVYDKSEPSQHAVSHIYYEEGNIFIEPFSRDRWNLLTIPNGLEYDDIVGKLSKAPDSGKVPNVVCDITPGHKEPVQGRKIDSRIDNCRYYNEEEPEEGEKVQPFCFLIGAIPVEGEVNLACVRGGKIVQNK